MGLGWRGETGFEDSFFFPSFFSPPGERMYVEYYIYLYSYIIGISFGREVGSWPFFILNT